MIEIEAHHERAHAPWSASATSSNWQCPGRMAMITLAPEDIESLPAATGTAAHTISERALRSDGDCDKYIGEVVETKAHNIVVTQPDLRDQIGAVPEPATWGLMILGFGGVGAAIRRRRRPLAAFA